MKLLDSYGSSVVGAGAIGGASIAVARPSLIMALVAVIVLVLRQ